MHPVSKRAGVVWPAGAGAGLPPARLHEIAQEAGVSLATVDRVVHRRPGVSEKTLMRVQQAVARLRESQARAWGEPREALLCFVLPAGDNGFVGLLRDELDRLAPELRAQGVRFDIRAVDSCVPAAAASVLKALRGQYDAIALMGPDHPLVRQAVDHAVADGTCVISLVSRISSRQRMPFVGIDNLAAGRTAAQLLGHHSAQRRGRVGLLIGSRDLRDHAERVQGFVERFAVEHPGLQVLEAVECRDRDDLAEARTRELLAAHGDLVGLYSAGAGNRGIYRALQSAGVGGRLAWVCHELTAHTRAALQEGMATAVISQPAAEEARTCCTLALAQLARRPAVAAQMGLQVHTRQDLQ